MIEIIEVLRQEHRNIEKLLHVLEEELSVFDRGDRPDYEVVLAVIDYFKDYPDSCHHPKEDIIVEKFKARDAVAAATIGDLEAEHREGTRRLRRVAQAVEAVLNDQDLLRQEDDVDRVLDRLHVELAVLTAELHQVERCEVASRIVDRHVLRARVGRVDPPGIRQRVPRVDRRVVLHARVGALPRRRRDLPEQVARVDRVEHGADRGIDLRHEIAVVAGSGDFAAFSI